LELDEATTEKEDLKEFPSFDAFDERDVGLTIKEINRR
jgi:hypothetical protein